jgi:protein gp37
MKKTKIEWADRVWNPVTGCSPISEGCKNCYAKKMAARLAGRFGYPADEPFRPGTLHSDKLTEPLNVKKPQRIFVCSMDGDKTAFIFGKEYKEFPKQKK